MENSPPSFIDGPNGAVAYRRRAGAGPGIVWFGGFRSDMLGTKADYLDQWAADQGRAFLRFDYTGHGESARAFEDGTISAWAADALAAFDQLTQGPQIIIGSSMGAWTSTLVARQRIDRVTAMIFIAPAPDFTVALMEPQFTDSMRDALKQTGKIETPSDYSDEPDVITVDLIEDGRRNQVLTAPLEFPFPVRILQGMADEDVPWRHAMTFAEHIRCADLQVLMTKHGDHRLSTPEDLERLGAVLAAL